MKAYVFPGQPQVNTDLIAPPCKQSAPLKIIL